MGHHPEAFVYDRSTDVFRMGLPIDQYLVTTGPMPPKR
jgi:hypothetical protein